MNEQPSDSVHPDEFLFSRVLSTMDIAVFERDEESGAFQLQGHAPAWWHAQFGPEPCGVLDLERWSPFLKDYLETDPPAGNAEASGITKSGPWTEMDRQGGTMMFEAAVLPMGSRTILLIERLGTGFEEMRAIVQRARERVLAEDVAAKTHRNRETRLTTQLETSERTKDDVLALLQHLGVAALVLDERGRITFASDRGCDLLGISTDKSIGREWQEVVPFQDKDRATVREAIQSSSERRTAGPFHLDSHHPTWVDLEFHPDLRASGRHILVINDRTELYTLRRLVNERDSFHDLVGKSLLMQRVYQLVRDVASVDTTVLIEGETGTGKELIARAIHSSSGRREKPFIAANCAGLTDSILTSQLFGHKRGAFTGAVNDQQGLFEAAEGGTLFLDEIGDIPPSVQTALLRVLQEKEITRLGETRPRKVNVRVLAATHHNLGEDVVRGSFRADLLYRIRIARVQLPPLRERRDDIPLLAQSFLTAICATSGKSIDRLHPEALHRLMRYPWPGNVRELRGAIEFAVIGCKGKEVSPDELPPEITGPPPAAQPLPWTPLQALDEKSRVLAALSDSKGNRTEAAKRLGVSRATFYRRLVELNIIHPR